ncbi:hypothetical protein [Moraxella porci]|nr:hypothetical protein [Moraxella porci]MDH2274065.1 hypothetical protein [Moraxella porci]
MADEHQKLMVYADAKFWFMSMTAVDLAIINASTRKSYDDTSIH